ncbi:response regulator [Kribbella sp. NPDC056345]|uniref:response regulator n=1 Tax=Kribbella sp. NPDC056345 TaxID=3345789 RepID=UPI0035D58952
MTIRVLLADDQAAIRQTFRAVVDAQPDMTVVAEAATGASAVAQALHLRPDVCLADIRMPKGDGLSVVEQLAGPQVAEPLKVIVVTTFDLDEYVHTALRNGAAGFVLKRSGPALLVEAIRAAAAGDVLISPQLTTRLFSRIREVPGDPRWATLTAREQEVAELVADGGTNADIAEQLVLSPGTVKNHLAAIQRKLGARNRVGIAAAVWSQRA